ncbi:MAG: acyl-CoA dehydrogenase family protein, partial [Hyphomonadaceae bacterium]
AENAAGIRQVLDATVAYAKERFAFGRPIGAYQAIKHGLAEIAGQAQCAEVATLYAAARLASNAPDASHAAAIAKAYSGEHYPEAARVSIQFFGAIGFTWEMPNHLYYKRALANAAMFGTPQRHRVRALNMFRADKTQLH